MDTLSFIRSKAERISVLLSKSGILAVLRHIEMAERHLDKACKSSESDLFTDVIYRANHAFEGILQESYAVLAAQDPTDKKAYEIESYLAENKVLDDRVMELFTNYRKKWRNPSTHNHIATFSESEAFLAILSVTSFIGILMDQMIERLAFDQEQARLAAHAAKLHEEMSRHASEPLVDRITFLLGQFAAQEALHQAASEVELAANLQAFLSTVAPSITLQKEPVLQDKLGTIQPDLLLRDGNEYVVVELKRYKHWTNDAQSTALDRVRRYIDASDARGGILLALPTPDAPPTGEKYNKTVATSLDDGRFLVLIKKLPRQDLEKP